MEYPDPHIHKIWGIHYVALLFTVATPECGKVLAFTRDVHLDQLHVTLEVKPEWIQVEEIQVPLSE